MQNVGHQLQQVVEVVHLLRDEEAVHQVVVHQVVEEVSLEGAVKREAEETGDTGEPAEIAATDSARKNDLNLPDPCRSKWIRIRLISSCEHDPRFVRFLQTVDTMQTDIRVSVLQN
jgi:hypothetical protein